jgi:hypothetical protein
LSNKYHKELNKISDKKMDNSAVLSVMKPFLKEVNKYPAAHIECAKPKRADAVQKGSNLLMPSHISFQTIFNEYSNSIILIGNEIAMPYMLKEVAYFNVYIEKFYQDIKKVNNIQELQSYYKQFKIKPKELVDALIKDLEYYSEKFDFDFDKKRELTFYKEEKLKFEEQLEKESKEIN